MDHRLRCGHHAPPGQSASLRNLSGMMVRQKKASARIVPFRILGAVTSEAAVIGGNQGRSGSASQRSVLPLSRAADFVVALVIIASARSRVAATRTLAQHTHLFDSNMYIVESERLCQAL